MAGFTLAGFIAGVGGVLGVWYYQTISPGSIDLTRTINILVIAVIGGMVSFEGAFLGALAFTLVNNFASSYTDRYNTVIGLTFLLIVLFSPNGIVGLVQSVARYGVRGLAREPRADILAQSSSPGGAEPTAALPRKEEVDTTVES